MASVHGFAYSLSGVFRAPVQAVRVGAKAVAALATTIPLQTVAKTTHFATRRKDPIVVQGCAEIGVAQHLS